MRPLMRTLHALVVLVMAVGFFYLGATGLASGVAEYPAKYRDVQVARATAPGKYWFSIGVWFALGAACTGIGVRAWRKTDED